MDRGTVHQDNKDGKVHGRTPSSPPMPWPSYAKLTDQDLKAICANLKSIKPVRNQVPPAVIPSQQQ